VIKSKYKKLSEELAGLQKRVLLKNYTTFKIGGPAEYFFIAKNKEDLISAVKTAKKIKMPVFIMGGGSNLLISEKGFGGLVIKMNIGDMTFYGNMATVGAGANLSKLACLAADRGLSGLEWASGIPGATIGGAIYGHAQAFGAKMSDVVKSVDVINLKTHITKTFLKKQCQFSLKNSAFKKNKNLVIISAVLEFRKKDKKEIKKLIKEFSVYRKKGHPLNFPSAGSIFINPEIHPVKPAKGGVPPSAGQFNWLKIKKIMDKYPELDGFIKRGVIPAGYLIQKSGLAGKKIGKAQISKLHSNFIINLGGARAKDVIFLIKLAQKKVKKKFAIQLDPEVQLMGF